MPDVITSFQITVPGTDTPLERHGDRYVCDERSFGQLDHGIWDLTRPERRPALDRFATQYARVRAAEQRDLEPDAIRALPLVDPDHPLAPMWQQRARTSDLLVGDLDGVDRGAAVDIGAGCGWLAARLAAQGWTTAAVDVTVDGGDGLALARHHDADLFLARAEMEALPFASASLRLAVLNASLHYAADVRAALAEAQRVLEPTGLLVVVDSPVFSDAAAGRQSVTEFAQHVTDTFGIEAAEHEGAGFVTEADLVAHELSTGCRWRRHEWSTGLRGAFHRWRGARRAGRETATRPLLVMHAGDSA